MTDKTTSTAPITARKSNSAGLVSIGVQLRCGGWNSDRARIDASTEISLDQARRLAATLVALCDQADAKAAKKAASDQRRKAWQDREVAAGRMKIMSVGEMLRGR